MPEACNVTSLVLYLLDDRSRRIALLDRDPDDAAAARFDDVAADDGVSAQSAPLTSTSGCSALMISMRVVFVEHDDRVHARERREHLGALGFGVDRTRRSLVGANRTIGVDADDQRVASRRACCR